MTGSNALLEEFDPSRPFTIERYVELKQWLAARRTGIGASESAIILGEVPQASAMKLYCQKLELIEDDDLSEVEHVEWGFRLEPVLADAYAEKTGRRLADLGRLTICRSTIHPWMFATLDREIQPIDDRGPGVAEFKTTGATHADEWEETVPRKCWIQLQHQLADTGYRWGSLAVLIGGQKFRWKDFDRDDQFIDQCLIPAGERFWRRVVEQDPPDPDGSYGTREALSRLYPHDTGAVVELGGEAIAWDRRLEQVKEEIKALEGEKYLQENRFKAAIGNATVGLLPSGVRYSLKSQTRAEYVSPEVTFRVLRRHKS